MLASFLLFCWNCESVIQRTLLSDGPTSPVPCWGWSRGRTPMATMAVRRCFCDAKEWLVSWIRAALSDSTGGHLATPGTRHTGRMWNVSEQGCSKGHSKTCHPSPLVIKECTARPRATHEEYWVWISLLFQSDFVFVCFSARWWWICRQQCPNLKRETARTPFRQLMFGWIVWCH